MPKKTSTSHNLLSVVADAFRRMAEAHRARATDHAHAEILDAEANHLAPPQAPKEPKPAKIAKPPKAKKPKKVKSKKKATA